jgi:hypothetical protein
MSIPTNEQDVNRVTVLVKLISVNPESEIQLYAADFNKENPDQQYVSIEVNGYEVWIEVG